jgi:hypothetical protein
MKKRDSFWLSRVYLSKTGKNPPREDKLSKTKRESSQLSSMYTLDDQEGILPAFQSLKSIDNQKGILPAIKSVHYLKSKGIPLGH